MKTNLPIICIMLASFCLNKASAQYSTFDLSKYKTADYERKMLVLTGNISGNYQESKSDNSYLYIKSFSPILNLNYDLIKNTRKVQQDIHVALLTNPAGIDFTSRHNPEYFRQRNKVSESDAEISVSASNRFYYSGKKFAGIDATGYINGRYSKNESALDNVSQSLKSRNFEGALMLPLRFGIGRIESVEDARLAVFILQDMQRNHQLSKEITDEDILTLAEKVTQLKNKRHFDARKRRIYDIQAVDSFLTLNGYTSAQNAVYFSSLIDNWEFANNPWRQAGKRYFNRSCPLLFF